MEEARETPLSPFSRPFSPRYSVSSDPLSIDPEIWLMAEQRIHEVLHVIQPNLLSDKRRKAVINYVKGLINGYFKAEVLAFGSVPLKTYLPDGDVDLIAFCYPDHTEDFARQVCALLKADKNSEFRVPYVEYIDAQVKVVKCTVEDIAVDISFNQISGICTLCFLEQADLLIGKDHIFKRSVLLIKSWFYYESRILGAHHGLLSTYALEVMVLYVISLCHISVRGPLEVLYRFLEYYSRFDWENYCITIHGPISLSSLVEKRAQIPVADESNIFLSKDFLKNCRDMFSVRIKSYEGEVHEFLVKHLNVLDPLKANNNLGRSVSKGSYHRIKAAMSYGIQKLQEILTLPGEIMGEGLEQFYHLSLERNGQGIRPDILAPVASFGTGKFEPFDLGADSDCYFGGLRFTQMFSIYNYAWDETTLTWRLHTRDGKPLSVGPDVFFPAPPFFIHLPPGANFSAYRARRSRGTGTYIPNVSSFKDYKRGRRRIPESARLGNSRTPFVPFGQGSYRNERNRNPLEKCEEVSENRLDLSFESFPALQGASKAGPPEIADISARFRAFEVSPPIFVPPHVAETNKPASSSMASVFASPGMGAEKKQELLESLEDKEKISAQVYKLENDMDFPALSV